MPTLKDPENRHTDSNLAYAKVKLVTERPKGGANTASVSCDLLLFALPKGQALEVWNRIQSDQSFHDLPIAILTVQGQEIGRVLNRAKGVSSHPKQRSPAESAENVKKLLRSIGTSDKPDGPVEAGELVIDPSSYRVTRGGEQTTLSVLEFRLLYYLATRPNRLFTRNQLHAAVWRGSRSVNPRIVDAYIRRLRVRIEADPEHPTHLKTLRGMGYLFDSAAGNGLC